MKSVLFLQCSVLTITTYNNMEQRLKSLRVPGIQHMFQTNRRLNHIDHKWVIPCERNQCGCCRLLDFCIDQYADNLS